MMRRIERSGRPERASWRGHVLSVFLSGELICLWVYFWFCFFVFNTQATWNSCHTSTVLEIMVQSGGGRRPCSHSTRSTLRSYFLQVLHHNNDHLKSILCLMTFKRKTQLFYELVFSCNTSVASRVL